MFVNDIRKNVGYVIIILACISMIVLLYMIRLILKHVGWDVGGRFVQYIFIFIAFNLTLINAIYFNP